MSAVPQVKLLGGMRALLGAKTVDVAATAVGDLLDELVARGGQRVAALLFASDGRTPHEDLRVLVNGRNVRFLDGWHTSLRAQDTVTIHFSGARGYPGG